MAAVYYNYIEIKITQIYFLAIVIGNLKYIWKHTVIPIFLKEFGIKLKLCLMTKHKPGA
jgi:hypothetical protein